MRFLSVLIFVLCTQISTVESAVTIDLQTVCRRKTTRVYGTGPIALVGLMNQWGAKYSDYRRGLGFDIQMLFNDSASHRAIPAALQPKVWYTSAHSTTKEPLPSQVCFPYLVRALVVIYNLPNISTVNLTLQTLAGIYSGNISKWSDPAIDFYNPQQDFPSSTILCVARMEDGETTTGLFTQFLDDISADWHTKYGSYFGPAFPNGVCCNSTKWPPGVIDFYALDVVGVVGIVSSVANTIGYITVPSITEYAKSLTMATLLTNDAVHVIEPTVRAQQRVMWNYLRMTADVGNATANSIMFTKQHLSTGDAYPMTSITYMTVNTSIVSLQEDEDCCTMMELIGFVEWLMDNNTAEFQLNQSYTPILPELADMIRDRMLKKITCNGRNIHDEYALSLQPQSNPSSDMWAVSFGAVGAIFILISIGYGYLYNQKRKRADVNRWLIDVGRFRFDAGNNLISIAKGKVPMEKADSIDSMASATRSTTAYGNPPESKGVTVVGQLKDLSISAQLDGNPVSLVEMNLARCPPINWSLKTKRLMTDMKSCSAHKNLSTILGVFCPNDVNQYLVTEYCSQGTLHYVLATCRYRLTDAIRRFLCLDVARAYAYLHERQLASGRLSSLTCYLDSSWSVKVTEWQNAALCIREAAQSRQWPPTAHSILGVQYHQSTEESKIDDEETLVRLIYSDAAVLAACQQQISEGALLTLLKQADAFSFGYLLAEIYSGHLPYSVKSEMDDFSYSDHLKTKFAAGGCNALRLPVLQQQTNRVVVQLVEQCLKTEPKMRPSFVRIHKLLNEMNIAKTNGGGGGGGGIVDVMMEAMDSYAHTLEEKVEERTAELKQLTKRMRDLLNEVLPPVVSEKLFNGQTVSPESFECVSIYFSDIVGFTSISAQSTPLQVMTLLNDLWLLFDSIIDKFDVYKVDTIGDAYMVCSGLPNRNGVEHVRNICQLALALLDACGRFKIPHLHSQQLRIRIGINSGPVTAGVVGSKMPQYCVFGDTVNTAARMESTSIPDKIQISHSVHQLLQTHFPNEFSTEYRGDTEVKGKGTMKTYWLLKPGMFKAFSIP